jgi:hypothetical protein
MDIRERLETALDYLFHDIEHSAPDDVAATRRAKGSDGPVAKSSGSKKRKRETFQRASEQDFDKRLSILVEAARTGGGKARGEHYRLEQISEFQGVVYVTVPTILPLHPPQVDESYVSDAY